MLADVAARARQRALTGDAIMGVRTGLGALDEKIGGLEAGTLTVLLARPNIGKTTLCNQWAYRVAAGGDPVLFVSFENPPADLIRKHLVRLSGVAALDVLRGKVAPEHLAAAASTFRRDVGGRLYYASATAATDVATIRCLAFYILRRHRDAGRVLVVVDYLQKLATRPPSDGRRGAGYDDLRGNVGRVTQELRDLAGELASPVLAIGSVNRAAYNRDDARPGLHSGKESGDLEYSAETVLILADEKDAAPAPPGMTPVRLEIAKNRYGPTGVVELMFNAAAGRFEERTWPAPTVNGRHAGAVR